MIPENILTTLTQVKNGGQSAPWLVSEKHVCEVIGELFQRDIPDLESLDKKSLADFILYDCSDKSSKNHGVESIRTVTSLLYERPAGDILLAVFLHIDILTEAASNALLRIFEDVPPHVLILVTSDAPGKILPTLQSRIVLLDGASVAARRQDPYREAIEDFLRGHHGVLFGYVFDKEFKKEQALSVISGLQSQLLSGTIDPVHARAITDARIALEDTNTIARYIVNQLLTTLLGDSSFSARG